MTKSINRQHAAEDVALERAMEALFRLGANRRFETRQTEFVGAAVTRAGYAVLRSLSDNDELSVRDVARAAVMDAATASRQVNQLVEDGLVLRRAADTDARAVTLSLTERGRAVYERIVRYRLNHLATVLGEWTAAERSTLAALVNRFTADLAAAEDPDMAGFEGDRR